MVHAANPRRPRDETPGGHCPASLAVAAFRGPVTCAPAGQGGGVAGGNRVGGRRPRAVRRRRDRLVRERVGRAHGGWVRLPRGRLDAPDVADHADRAGLVLHPARRLSGRAGAVPTGARGVRRRRRAERLPPGQHRHLRDVADVHRDHPRREPPGRAGRDARSEDLLHPRRRLRLRVPVRVRGGHVRAPVRAAARPSRPGARDRCGRGGADRRPYPRLPAQAARPDREGQAGRRDSRAPPRVPGARLPALVRSVAGQARSDRRVPRGLRDHGHFPHGDVGDGRQLDRQHGLRHAGRRGRQSGHQRGGARRRDRRSRPPPHTRSANSSPSPPGTSRSPSRSWSGRSAGQAAGSSSSIPTPTPR